MRTVPLRRVCTFRYGEALAADARADGDVMVYGSNGPVGQHHVANTSGPVIVVGRKGSHGKLHYVAEPVFAIDTTFVVDGSSTESDLRWLLYAMSSLHLDQLSSDVGVPGLSREKAMDQLVAFPSRTAQRRVADYIDAETARIDVLMEAKVRLAAAVKARSRSKVEDLLAGFPTVPLQYLTDPSRPVVYGIVQAGPEVSDGVP